jgi:hypothetical protein
MAKSQNRQAIVAYLQSHGSVEDPSGHATAQLKAALGNTATPTAFTQLIASLERNGTIRRTVRGKRTYRIDLANPTTGAQGTTPGLRSSPTPRASRVTAGDTSAPIPPKATKSARLVPATVLADSPDHQIFDADVDADEIAAALLARVTKLLTAPADTAGSWAKRRIAKLESQVSEFEKALARANSQVRTISEERDDLRSRLEQAEANLTILTSRSERPVTDAGRSRRRLGPDEQALLRELRSSRSRRPEQAV